LTELQVYYKLAEIPGVARDSRESEIIRVINYGIIKENISWGHSESK
jgi:hypothetical protein